jgi:hypothetical protein
MGSQDTSGFAVEIDLWCFLLSSTSAKMRWEAVTRRDDVTWWDVWPIAHNCVASGEMITSTADCQRRKMDRHVRAWTFIFISTWVCSLESFVTEDGLRVYNIQLCIFLFVTSKSKETLWLCVLGVAPSWFDEKWTFSLFPFIFGQFCCFPLKYHPWGCFFSI